MVISKGVLVHVCLGLCFLTIWQLEAGDTTRFVASSRSLSPTRTGTGQRSLISSIPSAGPCSVSPSSATIARTRRHTAVSGVDFGCVLLCARVAARSGEERPVLLFQEVLDRSGRVPSRSVRASRRGTDDSCCRCASLAPRLLWRDPW